MEARFRIRKKKNDNVGYVEIVINSDGKKFRYSTEYQCETKHWDSGFPKTINSTKDLRERLTTLKRKSDAFIASTIDEKHRKPTKHEWDELMDLIRGKVKKDVTINDYIARYTAYKFPIISKNTRQSITLHIGHFSSFYGRISLDDLSRRTCTDYQQELHQLDYEISTINGYIKNVKSFLNWLYDQDYTIINFSKYLKNIKQDEKPVISLTRQELLVLETAELNSPRLEKVRDVFLFSCYTALRFSDVKRFSKSLIIDGIIHIVTQKTGQSLKIPITPECQDILERYDYDLPIISEQKTNQYLKELLHKLGMNREIEKISQKVGNSITKCSRLSEEVTFHMGRKTYVTVALLNGMAERVVRAISGHKKDSEFRKYRAFISDDLSKEMKKLSLR